MRVKLLPERALLLGRNLIISDVHLGYEEVMVQKGDFIPSLLREIISKIKEIIAREKPKSLIVAGDLKHSFIPLKREFLEVSEFLRELTPLVDLVIVLGNHDTGLGWIKEKFGVEVVEEFELGKWKIAHGHKPFDFNRAIIGHEHPSIRLRDEVGAIIKVPVFLKSEDLIVLPAFSPWAYGNDISREVISPVLASHGVDNMEVIVPIENEVLNFGKYSELMKALQKLYVG
ncbi:metallophosphoesterase [Pyrococcus furiosus DSM 3638]|uniref:Calcineurin-like phosphoesterase domain-containing protein n=3 Tax=Pyrococcus furiosus TaxID=2261 RepID=Q8U0U8_PYRFU|nr:MULTISPECIES: metallophosphoesterase [Pyrococcus]AAL81608.1 hypothetical protein PF1484 [Pyrococcus furiosus DSM 3638]AFN04267.1 hypothetical protein PFC_06655 [Pyrococcus furiosus COM1]MDK2870620.1 uncharacterized protein [Pyrococcus sp.]QEK79112.1 metallophosphoesterase [Pyrococcus furiosus DSM 3638]